MAEALRRGVPQEKIHEITKIDLWFLDKYLNIIKMEKSIADGPLDEPLLRRAKEFEFLDKTISKLCGKSVEDIRALQKHGTSARL